MFAADGQQVWLRNILHVVRDEEGRAFMLRGLILEITESKLIEEALRESRLRLQLMNEQVPAILWSTDSEFRITYFAGKALSALNLEPDQLLGMSLYEYFRTANPKFPPISMHQKALEGESVSYEITNWMGRTYQAHLEPLRDAGGRIVGCLGIALDVTERKQAEEQARNLAVTDPLTGLANYRRLLEVLDAEILRYGRTERPFAVLLLDLDELKQINDTYGHLVGSRALCRLANQIRVHSRAIDTAARYGGDEFALVLPETGAAAAEQVARRIAERLANDGEQPALSVSVGAAVCPQDGRTVQQLLGAADRALYKKKSFSSRKLLLSS